MFWDIPGNISPCRDIPEDISLFSLKHLGISHQTSDISPFLGMSGIFHHFPGYISWYLTMYQDIFPGDITPFPGFRLGIFHPGPGILPGILKNVLGYTRGFITMFKCIPRATMSQSMYSRGYTNPPSAANFATLCMNSNVISN